jgi:PAS domain S-box-containing protein
MKSPEKPHDESARLNALRSSGLMHTDKEERFDRITRIAKKLFDVDIALLSLVADDIQWFKSRQGLDATQTDRNISFCGHAILQDSIFVVPDASLDSRFADNPLVTGAPGIRFYAGAPVQIDNCKIGTLCLIHPEPRSMPDEALQMLRDLADLIELELRQIKIKKQLKRAELAEQRLEAVIQGTNVGTWEWNIQTGEIVINERWANISGYSLDELEPSSINTWKKLTHPDDLDKVTEAMLAHFNRDTEHFNQAYRVRHKHGHWVWVQDRGKLVSYSADGKPLVVSGTHADISDQIKSQLALHISEARLRGLFELSPFGIALNDFDTGAFIEINQALVEPTGYSLDEFTTLSYWQITPEEYAPQEEEQLLSMQQTGRYGPYEKEYRRKDGSRYPVLLNGVVVHDTDGRKLIWSIVEDISERKRMERMKNEFVSTVSHELRTPLTAIRGALSLICSGKLGELPEAVAEMATVAERNSHRLLSLINDLLDMEKLLIGKMTFNLQWHALTPLIHNALQENEPFAELYQVSLKLSDNNHEVDVMVDATRFGQVMANLLSNAIKFSPAGADVQISLDMTAESVRVTVSDQGPGIPDEFRARIFHKFSQADSSDSRQRGGTGLGLAISRELMEKMNGRIDFTSAPDAGSQFYIELPSRPSNDSRACP